MRAKIDAARTCMEAGCDVVIANGKEVDVIRRIVEGEEMGTLFCRRRLS
jgi:glutamate 5-kinase